MPGNLRTAVRVDIEVGSSPLARGTRRAMNLAPEAYRFIPARAGNTI